MKSVTGNHLVQRVAAGVAAVIGCLGLAFSAGAQSTQLFYESFNDFPGAIWTVGDANAANGSNYWGAVDSAYGGEGAFAGSFKGYCAARTPTGTNLTATYPVSMTSFASRTINLAGFTRSNLRFWYKTPSLGAGDSWRVLMDGTTVTSGNTVVAAWTEQSINLNTFAGASRTLRFEFISDAAGTAEGMYLDAIEATAANANVTETFGPVSLNNYTGYVIDSDAASSSPGFDREGLAVASSVTAENFQVATTNLAYRFTYWLRDTNGTVFPVRTLGGVTNAAQNYVATNTLVLGNGDRAAVVGSAFLVPIGRLSHLTSYSIECEIARTNGVVLSRSTNGPYRFHHFTNMVSGDPSLNVIAEQRGAGLERTWLVNTVSGGRSFVVTNHAVLVRYDDVADGAAGTDPVPVRFDLEMRNAATDALIPLNGGTFVTNVPVFSYEPFTSSPPQPRVAAASFRIDFRPAIQLNSVDATYRLIVRMSHTNSPGQAPIADGSITNGPARFLHYNGTLLLGDVSASIQGLATSPSAGAVTPGSHIATVVRLANNGATIGASLPPVQFGDGSDLGVQLRIDGTGVLTSGTQSVPGPTAGVAGNVRFERGAVTLGPSGATAASIAFTMPSGFGWSTNIDLIGQRLLQSDLTFASVGLNASLAPRTNLVLLAPPGGSILASEESKSFYMVGSALTWEPAGSRFVITPTGIELLHTRGFDYFFLAQQRSNLVSASMADLHANDGLYNFVDQVTGSPVITADANGTARLTLDLTFKPAAFFATHFPYENYVGWNNGGTMSVVNDEVVVGPASRLLTTSKIIGQYSSACEGCGGTATNSVLVLTPPGGELRITRDGGLVSLGDAPLEYGNVGVSNKLAWGFVASANDFAQAVIAPTNAAFHMPGSFLLGGLNTSGQAEDAPAVLLLSGVAATNHALIERPLTPGYLQGRADYAGFNLRVRGDGFRAGRSLLAGQPVDYLLRGSSKYYARRGGVTGRHSAVGGSFPPSLTLLGYGLVFSNYSLAFLDGQNVGSKTAGLLSVPYPSNFQLAFDELDFTCPGGLAHATIQNGPVSKKLEWWNADFDALAIQFVQQPGAECDPGRGWLTIGVNAYAAHIDVPLVGVLGFKTNGTLIAAADQIAGIDSRLSMPPAFEFSGPAKTNVTYKVTTVGKAYYSAYNPDGNKVPQGFISFAGRMDVPFFEDMKIHAHVSATKGGLADVSPMYLMGGWPKPGGGAPNQGWQEAGGDFFATPGFDPANTGYPTNEVQVVNYRASGATPRYKPRAQKRWLDVVELDYALNWDSNTRNFKSVAPVTNDFFIVKAKHEVAKLNAKTAELKFGATYQGVPHISVGGLLADLGETSGVLDAITEAIGDSDAGFIVEGLDAFGDLVGEGAEKLSKTIMDEGFMPLLDTTYAELKAAYDAAPATNKWAFTNAMTATISNLVLQFTNVVIQSADYTKQGAVLIKDINAKLGKVDKGLTSTANALLRASNAPVIAAKALSKVLPQQGKNLGVNLSNIIEIIQPALNSASHTLTNLKKYIPTVRAALTNGGELAAHLNTVVQQAAPEMLTLSKAAGADAVAYFMDFDYSVDNPFNAAGQQQLRERLRQFFEQRLLQSSLVPHAQTVLKHRFYDADASLRSSIESYFDGVNGIIRSILEMASAPLDDSINGALDSVKGYLGAVNLTGSAQINEDSLRLLRLDGGFSFKVPEEVKFGAYLEIKEIDSENSFEGCTYAGGTATEIRLGAKEVPLKWISPGLKATIGVGFVLDADNHPAGASGLMDMTGKLKIGGITVKKAGFAVAFGEVENYLAANCRAQVGKSVEIAAGLFLGRACSYDPLTVAIASVSPKLGATLKPATLFGTPPFTGAFAFAEGTFPVWSAGCMLEVRMTVGGGGWYFAEGPRYGGLLKIGAQGTVICLLNGEFDGTVIGSQKSPDEGMVYVGSVRGKVSIGWCDFCIEAEDDAIWQKIGDGDFERIDKD